MLICQTAVYESGFLDDRQAADLFRFPLCVRALNRQRGQRSAELSTPCDRKVAMGPRGMAVDGDDPPRQEIVFIGTRMREELIRSELDACLS